MQVPLIVENHNLRTQGRGRKDTQQQINYQFASRLSSYYLTTINILELARVLV
jgi:hypothetical protein